MASVQLPTGKVSFLFTDLEGSTKLFEAHPADYPDAVARHTHLLRDAVVTNGGVVFETVGDAVYSAFSAPTAAAAAAIAGQLALESEEWGPVGRMRARMGLHSGEAQAREGHYVGAPLYRCARLMAAGWGGQIVLSSATAGMTRDALPRGAVLRDLGEHRLKDLQAPERIFQLWHQGLLQEFPPLRAVSARPNNLPVLRDAFVGREGEMGAARDLLSRGDVGLLTVTGPGGVGKTRFALHLAAEAIDDRRAGVWVVDLSQLLDSSLVPDAIAATFGLRESAERDRRAAVLAYLKDSDALLLLDNFEQLTPAAEVVAELLMRCPDLRVIVTSREPLRIRGEQEFPLGPLESGPYSSPESSVAADLFVERARRVVPSFVPSKTDLATIDEICARLDGLPLAIELASARIRTMPPQAILARLEHRLPLLTGGPRDLPARQRTLRDAIKWSYDLLSAEEQAFLRRLAVFRGSWTTDGAAAVSQVGDVDGLTDALVAKSLLVPVGAVDGSRFRMLGLVREFAAEELERDGEARQVRERHARHVAASLDGAAARMRGEGQLGEIARIELAIDDIRQVLAAGIREPEEFGQYALKAAAELYSYWFIHANIREAGAWAGDLIATFGADRVPAGVHAAASFAAGELGELRSALGHADHAIRAARGTDPCGALWPAAMAFEYALGADEAEAERYLELTRAVGDECGSVWARGLTTMMDGELARYRGDLASAVQSYESALRLLSADPMLKGASLQNLAQASLRSGDHARAARLFAEMMDLPPVYSNWMVPYFLAGEAAVATALGEPERAAVLIGATSSALSRLGMLLQPIDNAEHERNSSTVRQALGAERYQEAELRGRSMITREAVAFARGAALTDP